MNAEATRPDYLFWPSQEGYDLPTLHAAERQAIDAMRRWHFADGEDVTVLGGLSLGRLWRYGLSLPVMTMFRQAARGAAPDSPRLWDDGTSLMYRPERVESARARREDPKAAAFRVLHRALALPARRPRRRALVMGSPSNRGLWREWLDSPRRGDLALDFFLAQPPGLPLALRASLAGARAFDPAPAELAAAERRRLDEIRESVAALPRRAEWRALMTFRGVDLSDAFAGRLLTPFLDELEDLARKRAAFAAELDRLAPSLLLLPQESSADALILIHLARERAIPYWFLNHGFPGAGYRFEQAPHCGDLSADRVLAWGPGDRENYLRAGVDEKKILIAGNPAFDAMLPASTPRPFRGTRDASVLVVAQGNAAGIRAAYFDDAIERFFLDVVGLLDRLGAARVIYKLHPGRSRREFYEALLRRARPSCVVEILQEESFRSVLDRADWVVGPSSTVIFETLLSGKDYFFFNNDPLVSPAPFGIENSYVAKTADELERNLAANNPVPREKILREFCGLTGTENGRPAARKVLDLIEAELAR